MSDLLLKPLIPRSRHRWRPILIISGLILLIALVISSLAGGIGFVRGFLSPPDHFTYSGHSDIVYAVAWSPDGARIASASADHTVQVWNADNGGLPYRIGQR